MTDQKIPNSVKFLFGGLAGMGGTCVVHPADVVKTRMQISGSDGGKREYENTLDCIRKMLTREGPFSFYQGIGAGLLRQATYTTGRMGVYTYLIDHYRAKYNRAPTIGASILMGLTAGACGAFIGTPAEVALIRMASDGRLPPSERRNYKNVVDALVRIVKEEGGTKLWRGCVPTIERAMVINMVQLASYSQLKGYFIRTFDMKEGLGVTVCAASIAGLLTTIVSMPFDIAKTRLQNMKIVDGVPEYKGMIDVITRAAKHEGFLSLWKGFTPYFCRLTPHTILVFVLLEKLNKLYFKYVLGDEGKSSGI